MTILGVDPGLTTTGIAVMRDGLLVHHDQLSTSPDDLLVDRIEEVRAWVETTAVAYSPSYAKVELLHGGYRAGDIARVKNFVDLRNLALLTGAVIGDLTRQRIRVELVTPAVWKIAKRSIRREVKKQIARAVVEARYGKRIPEHASEAILLCEPATETEIAAGWATVSRRA